MGSAHKNNVQNKPGEKQGIQNPLSPAGIKLKIRQILIRTHVHATESIEKVLKIFQNLLLLELTDKQIRVDNCSGAYGQRITNIEVNLTTKKFIQPLIIQLGEKLSDQNKLTLSNQFSQRLDSKYKLYLRIDKQQAFQGRIELATTPDAIQFMIAIQNKSPMIPLSVDIVKNYFITRQLL